MKISYSFAEKKCKSCRVKVKVSVAITFPPTKKVKYYKKEKLLQSCLWNFNSYSHFFVIEKENFCGVFITFSILIFIEKKNAQHLHGRFDLFLILLLLRSFFFFKLKIYIYIYLYISVFLLLSTIKDISQKQCKAIGCVSTN